MTRGRVRIEKGLQAQGLADFERAIAIDGSSASPYYQRAIANQRQSRFEDAQRDYQQAIRLTDGLSDGELQYARNMLRGLESKARIHYQRAIESHKQGRVEEAKADYREAIRLADGLSDAELKYAQKNLDGLDSKARFYYERGYDNYKQGRLKKAKADYEEAIRLAGGLSAAELQYAREQLNALNNVARFYYDRAEKHYRYGRLQEAREDYEEAVRLVAGLTPVELEHARARVRSIPLAEE